jgi:hypothetical protein
MWLMITLVLAVIALVLAAIAQIRAQGHDLVAWAVIALALIPLLAGVAEL